MEQALLNRLKDGTADEIDVDMIASRCMNANEKLLDLMHNFTDELQKLTEEYEEEFKIGGCTVIMAYTDKPTEMMGRDAAIKIAYGRGPRIRGLLENLQKEVTK